MPNYYAHLQFGARVLRCLPEHISLRIANEYDAFVLGQYGPDPLYFCYNRKARAIGREIHHRPVRETMERMRLAVENGVPFSAGYAAGFLCHFALDSRCHAYIKRLAGSDSLRHAAIETEFDRLLMVYDGVNVLAETPMPNPLMPASFHEMLEKFIYPSVKGECFKKGMDMYQKCNIWHTKTARSKIANTTLGQITKHSKRGVYLNNMIFKRASESGKECSEAMLKILEDEVYSAVGKISQFCLGAPLDKWYDRDFFGGGSSMFLG